MAFHYGWYAGIPFVALGTILAIAQDGPAIKRQMNWAVDRAVRLPHLLALYFHLTNICLSSSRSKRSTTVESPKKDPNKFAGIGAWIFFRRLYFI